MTPMSKVCQHSKIMLRHRGYEDGCSVAQVAIVQSQNGGGGGGDNHDCTFSAPAPPSVIKASAAERVHFLMQEMETRGFAVSFRNYWSKIASGTVSCIIESIRKAVATAAHR